MPAISMLLDHGMAAFDNLDIGTAVVECGTAIAAIGRQRGKRCEHVNFRQSQRGLPDAARLGGNRRAQFRK